MNQICAESAFAEAEGVLVGTKLLQGQYLIHARLSSGGFGITYLATDSLARQVVVKECYPSEICTRHGVTVQPASPDLKLQFSALKNQFVREARQMAQLVHPNIVAVHQVFEENDTAYMALDHIDGIDLVTLVEDQPTRINNALVRSVLRQSLKALNFIHNKGLLHRDIAPDNMMMNSKSHLTLIDFGAAKERDELRSTLIAVKDGYSPIEFYDPNGVHGFHSDIYSLAATLYYLAVGTPPPSSELRQEAIDAGKTDPLIPLATLKNGPENEKDKQIFATIDRALSMAASDRYDSIAEWAKDLVQRQEVLEPDSEKIKRNPILESEIAEIVERTNAQLASSKPQQKNDEPDKAKNENGALAKKTVVDIFGNPVENVLAWHEKQEAEIQARQKARVALLRQQEQGDNQNKTSDEALADIAPDLVQPPIEIEMHKEATPPIARRFNPLSAFLERYKKTDNDPASR